MLVQQDNLKLLLGLSASITDEEQAFISLIHPLAEGLVKQYLKYDPEQKEHTEYFPRHLRSGGPGYGQEGRWSVSGSRAIWESLDSSDSTLQLTHLPLRNIVTVHVDTAALHGDADGAFAASTLWTEGTDYYGDWDQADVGYSGQLYSYGSWPSEPGTVKVVYRAGYSPAELLGTATEDAVAGEVITTAGVDGSGITRAVHITVISQFLKNMALKKKDIAGFTPGALLGERLGDYSYQVDSGTFGAAGLAVSLPDEAKEQLEAYRHWGLARL